MIDYIKKNHLGLVIILWLVASSFLGGGMSVGSIARDTTNITNPFNFQQGMTSTSGTFSGNLAVAGTTVVDEFTQGGSILATSTDGTAHTISAADLLTYSGWSVTVELTDLTYTFPAVAELSTIVPTAGDSRTWFIENATSTSGIDVIFAGGSGTDIKSSGAGALTLDEESHGTFTLYRKADGDIMILTNFPNAD